MKAYLDNVKKIMTNGEVRPDRTGTGTTSYFGTHFEHDMKDGFPLMTHKKMETKSIFAELVWFLAGSNDSHQLEKLGSKIWKKFAAPNGSIGPMYGSAWRGRHGHPVDQIAALLKELKFNAMSRRHYVSTWSPSMLPDPSMSPSANAEAGRMSLAPCHTSFQFYITVSGQLHLSFEMRSSDTLLGAPFNIASYGAMLNMFAYLLDLTPGRLIANFGDSHIYMDHIECGGLAEVLNRPTYELPSMDLSDIDELNYARQRIRGYQELTPVDKYSEVLDYLFDESAVQMISGLTDSIKNYQHGDSIKMKVSV